LPVRTRAALAASFFLAATLLASLPAPAAAGSQKVTIIVGPVGSLTSNYRSSADRVATAAAAAGATVVKVYSPNATWANVRAAVAGANVVVYFGHGNGYPNPYSATENPDRVNGWGLNRTTTNGDADNWSTTLVYCGEKALLGTLTSTDGTHQWNYCGGKTNTDGIAPAAGFTMVYAQAHYAPGFGERYAESDPIPTLSEAQQRVRNYSYPVLRLGARGYIATAYGDADDIVARILTQPTRTYGDIFRDGEGYSAANLKTMAHPDIAGAEVWVQKTVAGSLHFGDPDYWYALAANPNTTPSGTAAPAGPTVTRRYPSNNSTNASTGVIISATFDQAVTGVSGASFYLRNASGAGVNASVTYNAYWKRAELRPASALSPGATYVATLTSAITSIGGQAITPTSWRFTTVGADDEAFSPYASLTFRQGSHSGYRWDAAGSVTTVRTVTLSRDSGAATSVRAVLPNQSGRWFYVVNGAWAGYWVRESSAVTLATTAIVANAPADAVYDPPSQVAFGLGTHTGYRFDAAGAVMGERTYTLASPSGASTSMRRQISNQYGSWFYMTNGVWGGYWLRESDVVRLP